MSATCNGCGDCCDPVHLPEWAVECLTEMVKAVAEGVVSPFDDPEAWIARKWNLSAAESAYLNAGWFSALVRRPDGRFDCPSFDREARRCLIHATRPPVCRDYPWYGKEPAAGALDSSRCSYWEDIAPDQRPRDWQPVEIGVRL